MVTAAGSRPLIPVLCRVLSVTSVPFGTAGVTECPPLWSFINERRRCLCRMQEAWAAAPVVRPGATWKL